MTKILNTSDILQKQAEDWKSPDFERLLNNLQANILKYHGRQKAVYAFLHFTNENARSLKDWLRNLDLTSAYKQFEDIELANKELTELSKLVFESENLSKTVSKFRKLLTKSKGPLNDLIEALEDNIINNEEEEKKHLKKAIISVNKKINGLKKLLFQIKNCLEKIKDFRTEKLDYYKKERKKLEVAINEKVKLIKKLSTEIDELKNRVEKSKQKGESTQLLKFILKKKFYEKEDLEKRLKQKLIRFETFGFTNNKTNINPKNKRINQFLIIDELNNIEVPSPDFDEVLEFIDDLKTKIELIEKKVSEGNLTEKLIQNLKYSIENSVKFITAYESGQKVLNVIKGDYAKLKASFERLKNMLEVLFASPEIVNFYLSYKGYVFFNKRGAQIPDGEMFSFKNGLEATNFFKQNEANFYQNADDYKPDQNFESKNQIHALLQISFAGKDIGDVQDRIEEEIAEFGKVVFFESGYKNRTHSIKGETNEWFGFKDGISNPRFFPSEGVKKRSDYESPSKLDLVLRRCTGGLPISCGSFMTFLKFEQHPKAFERLAESLANKLSDDPDDDDIKYAGALIVGRHDNGTPLTISKVKGTSSNLNAFDYSKDKEGYNCPFHAHIRKANPREGNESRRIVRRGMIYGHDDNHSEKGILFTSFQADLELQFEYLMDQRLIRNQYNGKEVGRDPFIGRLSPYRKYNKNWGNGNGQPIHPPSSKLTTFKGGMYFFAPSIRFVKKLGDL